jgi:PadR family transcriptional regulator, regulatory protein PadR
MGCRAFVCQRLAVPPVFSYNVGEMGTANSLGQFELLVLTAVLTLEGRAYGVTIHAKVEELSSPKKVALGAVYATLDRMEEKGFILSRMSKPTAERGGRSRRYYRLESSGVAALHEATLIAKRICEVLEQSWGAPERSNPSGSRNE